MSDINGIKRAKGLTTSEADELDALLRVYDHVQERNNAIEHYYEGDVMAKDIGVDILPQEAKERVHVDLSCDWARKAVKSLANHVRFDGFVFDGRDGMDEGLRRALGRIDFDAEFSRTRMGTLKKGCAFACVNNFGTSASVTFHSADNGAAIMNEATGRIRSGFVIADSGRTEWAPKRQVVTRVNLHMPGNRVAIVRDSQSEWHAEHVETPADTMMMVPFVYEPTDKKPLGGTRITKDVRSVIDDVLSVRLAIAISRAFYAIPMRYVLGLTENMYERLQEKPQWNMYINPILLATMDKQGHTPTAGQLPSNQPDALIRLIETDAKMFAAATGVPLNSLGIVQDNPSSAEAIVEARRDLIEDAQSFEDEHLIPALRQIALLVMMVESNRTSVDDLDDVQRSVMPHFKNPAMPSIASTTDAAMKIASVNPAFASTDVFFEMVGFDQATIARVNSQIRMAQARQSFGSILAGRQQQPQAQQPEGLGLATEETDAD
jgi:hypothetical protein